MQTLAAVSGSASYLEQLEYDDRQTLWKLKKRFGGYAAKDLIHHIYTSYPYYATRSEIASKRLNDAELKVVMRSRPKVAGYALCSIGYEGLSLEGYLNKLIRHGVTTVCDVRKNPLSRKFGFSKKVLSNALQHLDIEYLHFP